jgi:hypothetical protein
MNRAVKILPMHLTKKFLNALFPTEKNGRTFNNAILAKSDADRWPGMTYALYGWI